MYLYQKTLKQLETVVLKNVQTQKKSNLKKGLKLKKQEKIIFVKQILQKLQFLKVL